MANGSRHALYLVQEANYGVTPASPALKKIRHNTTNLGVMKNLLESAELRDDRMPGKRKHGTRQAGGDIVCDLTHGGSMHDMIEAVLCGSWAANVCKAGTTRKSFSIMRDFADLGAGQKRYHLYKGQEFNTLKLGVNTEGFVQITFGVVGKGDMAPSTTTPATPTFPAATTGDGFDLLSGTINEGGAPIAVVTEVELSLENGIEPRFVLGSRDTLQGSIQRARVSGQLTCHFENDAMLDKFISGTNSTLNFTMGDGTNTLLWTLPNILYTGGQPDVGGDGPIMLVMPFEAEYDATAQSNITVTRSGA
jgi:hypothetical protein